MGRGATLRGGGASKGKGLHIALKDGDGGGDGALVV
jgi:hypothetical protein